MISLVANGLIKRVQNYRKTQKVYTTSSSSPVLALVTADTLAIAN